MKGSYCGSCVCRRVNEGMVEIKTGAEIWSEVGMQKRDGCGVTLRNGDKQWVSLEDLRKELRDKVNGTANNCWKAAFRQVLSLLEKP